MTETWLEKLERDISRQAKAKKQLRKEVDDKIEQLRVIEAEIADTLDKALSSNQASREDVEWDLLDARINGGTL